MNRLKIIAGMFAVFAQLAIKMLKRDMHVRSYVFLLLLSLSLTLSIAYTYAQEAGGISFIRNISQPELQDVQTVQNRLVQKFTETNAAIVTLIDTGVPKGANVSGAVSDQITDIKVHFQVSNQSDDKERFTIHTGIPKGLLNNIRIEGATGYRWEDGKLAIAYVPLAPGASAFVTLTALPMISERSRELRIEPVLINKLGTAVATGNAETAHIVAKSPSAAFSGSIGSLKVSPAEANSN